MLAVSLLRDLMKAILGTGCVIAGWLLASVAEVAVGGILPALLARNAAEYRMYLGLEILILTTFFAVALYHVIGRRIFHWPRDYRPYRDRLPAWARQPTPVGLVVAWVVAVCTVIVYPLAIYMSWRFYKHWRARQRTCPQCAETVKAAALVCRYCGQKLGDVHTTAVAPSNASATTRALASLGGEAAPVSLHQAKASRAPSRGLVAGFALVFLGSLVLIYLGLQPRSTANASAAPVCVIVATGDLGRIVVWYPWASVPQCDAEFASARESFGPDTASNQLSRSEVVPEGWPVCTIGRARYYTFGEGADVLRSRICPSS
jgi:hypothetical protein